MNASFLEFEKPIAELEDKLTQLRELCHVRELDIGDEMARLTAKSKALTESIFASLTPWQIAQVARHPMRPHTLDYIARLFSEFHELRGDRLGADDPAIVGGLARLDGQPIVVIGHQKGRDTPSKLHRNFGMPRPEGYRKALRLMQLAGRFRIPLVTLIDTPGAYPGIDAESRGQSAAIAQNLFAMVQLPIPIVCVVIGEGGSGGALAIGVGDRLLMLQYSTYAVISPEGCAAILWNSAERASEAAEAMGMTAPRLKQRGLIDAVLPEPLGGAHRDPDQMAATLQQALINQLHELATLSSDDLLSTRYQRWMHYGFYKDPGVGESLHSPFKGG